MAKRNSNSFTSHAFYLRARAMPPTPWSPRSPQSSDPCAYLPVPNKGTLIPARFPRPLPPASHWFPQDCPSEDNLEHQREPRLRETPLGQFQGQHKPHLWATEPSQCTTARSLHARFKRIQLADPSYF